ncbi:MAG: DUF1810 domain-containing protein [Cardiobacteriaceae bacterium]|nr:DUF1810 domain-containing protein [Cardiobacteriaceae bacterium]
MNEINRHNSAINRFISAQKNYFEIACEELKQGKKESHWMWFIFPQIAGLGLSEISQFYAIRDIAEARKFIADKTLGTNLVKICQILLTLNTNSAEKIFGDIDSIKLRSSMTLFAEISDDDVFQKVLDKFFQGKKDTKTLELLHK